MNVVEKLQGVLVANTASLAMLCKSALGTSKAVNDECC